MGMLFDIVPRRFFNPLAAVTNGSSGQICASCLLSFNQLFASEAQVPREEVRDAVVDVLAAGNITGIDDPLLEPEAEAKDDFLAARKEKNMSQEQVSDEDEEIRLRMDLANRILKYLSDEEVGWIEEGVDNGTLHRTFMITEQAMLLADYIERASSQKFDEMSNYLYNSYLVVTDFSKNVEDRMNNHPYTSVILNVYSNIVKLNGQLKLLRRSIRRIVKKVTGSLSFDELMDHLSEYLDGEFIGEFTRLINNENASLFSGPILTTLHRLVGREKTRDIFITDCMATYRDEQMTRQQALDRVMDQVGYVEDFLKNGYNGIIRDIRNQMVDYIMITRLKLKMGMDLSAGSQDRIAHFLQILAKLDPGMELPEEMNAAFRMTHMDFISTQSVRGARIVHGKIDAAPADAVTLSEDELEEARMELKSQSESPHTRQKMKIYTDFYKKDHVVRASDLPLATKEDITNDLAAASFAGTNDMRVTVDEHYLQSGTMRMRDFTLVDEEVSGKEQNNGKSDI